MYNVKKREENKNKATFKLVDFHWLFNFENGFSHLCKIIFYLIQFYILFFYNI